MKHLNKMMLLFLFILASFTRDIAAYRYTITNLTGRRVRVQLFFTPFSTVITTMDPFETEVVSPEGAKVIACLTKIMVSSFFDEKEKRWWGEIKAPIKEVDPDQFNKTKAAVKEFTDAFKLGMEGGLSEAATILTTGKAFTVVTKTLEGLAQLASGATALAGASLCRNRDFMLILGPLMYPATGTKPSTMFSAQPSGSVPVTTKEIVDGEIVEKPVLVPYALSSP